MTFKISGLNPKPFLHLYGQSDAKLEQQNILRVRAETSPGFPDRIEMREAIIGETLLLLNHTSQPANSPYQARHAIYVLEGATECYQAENEIPEVMRARLLSLRGFDKAGMMHEGEVVKGVDLETAIGQIFENPEVDYIHAHNAGRGCYSGRIDRA